MTITTSWTSPSTPIPRTLPISRSRGSIVDRTTSTTRLCFSSTTPVRTHVPKVKIEMNRRITPTFANRNDDVAVRVRRLELAQAICGGGVKLADDELLRGAGCRALFTT